MPGTRDSSFPEGHRRAQALTRRHSFRLVGAADKLNAVNSLQGRGTEMKSTASSEKREATVDYAIPDSFLEKEGF